MAAGLLTPFVLGAGLALGDLLWLARSDWRLCVPLATGAGVYVLLHLGWRSPMIPYVFGHEITHAGAALLSGHRVMGMKVSSRGGHVTLSGSNLLVALAPYVFPFYTGGVVVVMLVVHRSWPGWVLHPAWVEGACGLTFAFHAFATARALAQPQPDLDMAGRWLSWTLILLGNSVSVLLLLKWLYPQVVSVPGVGEAWWRHSQAVLQVFGAGMLGIFQKAVLLGRSG